MARVYGYCRVSTLRQASEGESLDVQKRQIEGYAHMHALVLDDVIVEEGVSGSVPVVERPMGVVRSSPSSTKVTWSSHRSSTACSAAPSTRSPWSRTFASAASRPASARPRQRPLEVVSDHRRRLCRGRARSDTVSGFRQSKADQKKRGRYLGGIVPFGFRRGDDGELVPHAAEQQAIREIRRLRAQGRPLRAIAEASVLRSRSAS